MDQLTRDVIHNQELVSELVLPVALNDTRVAFLVAAYSQPLAQAAEDLVQVDSSMTSNLQVCTKGALRLAPPEPGASELDSTLCAPVYLHTHFTSTHDSHTTVWGGWTAAKSPRPTHSCRSW